MACVADSVISAPFATLGSIGVMTMVPNFHERLKREGIHVRVQKGNVFVLYTVWGSDEEIVILMLWCIRDIYTVCSFLFTYNYHILVATLLVHHQHIVLM